MAGTTSTGSRVTSRRLHRLPLLRSGHPRGAPGEGRARLLAARAAPRRALNAAFVHGCSYDGRLSSPRGPTSAALRPPPDTWQPSVPPRRRRSTRFVAVVIALCVAAASFAGAAALVGRPRPPVRRADRARVPGLHDRRLADAVEPVRPIHYVVNVELAPADRSRTCMRPCGAWSQARPGSPSRTTASCDEIPTASRSAYEPELYPDDWAPVLVAWVDPEETDIAFQKEGQLRRPASRGRWPRARPTPS